jgi:hypothetical protein
MNIRVAVNFRSRSLKDLRFHALCEPNHVYRAMNAGLGRLHRVPLVMYRGRRTGEVIDFIDLNVERERDVVAHQLEMLVIEKMLNVLASAGEKVIGAENVSAVREKALSKMRAKKPSPSGNQNSLLQMHYKPLIQRGLLSRPKDCRHLFRTRRLIWNRCFFAVCDRIRNMNPCVKKCSMRSRPSIQVFTSR